MVAELDRAGLIGFDLVVTRPKSFCTLEGVPVIPRDAKGAAPHLLPALA
jgi:hypothetical protein